MSDYTTKLDSLTLLKDGWNGYHKSRAITAEAVETARHLTVCPSPDGGLQIEIHAGGADVEIEIDPNGKVMSAFFKRA